MGKRKRYRSPFGRTAAAAAAPSGLADEYGGYAVWSDRPDGSLEVVTLREGCLYRHLVHDDGTTSVIDHDPDRPGRQWALLAGVGFGFNLLILGGMASGVLSVKAFPLFLIGMAVMAIGTIADQHVGDPVKRLQRNPVTAGKWYEPVRLSGWVPHTCAQLAAVEQLADDYNGVVRVRDAAGDAVDVRVRSWGRRVHYLVDSTGHAHRTKLGTGNNWAPWHEVRTIEEEPDPG